MIISFSGSPGSGKSTVAKMLAEKLDWPRYYVGQMLRDIAKKHGMTLDEFFEVAKKDPKFDKEIDDFQKKLGETEDNFVIEGRTSFHFIPHSFKIYLECDLKKAAERVYSDIEKNKSRNELHTSKDGAYESLKAREEGDAARYKKMYGFDHRDKSNYDLIIDTTDLTPEEVFRKVLKEVNARK